MAKFFKIIGVLLLVVLLLLALLVFSLIRDRRIQAEDQAAMVKTDEELLGQHLYIQRDGREPVDVNAYFTAGEARSPLVINLHGGAFVAGDADTLDTQSHRISQSWNVHVVTVNYTLLSDGHDKAYAIREICDTVRYFIDHADTYRVDPDRIILLGYSAGGYYAMASTAALVQEGIPVKGQILCYAFLGDMAEQFSRLSPEQKRNIPPALFILPGMNPSVRRRWNTPVFCKKAGYPWI